MESIKVFICGGASSGKTVYLSALYKSLMVPKDGLGLRCETSAVARDRLMDIHANLPLGFPPPTTAGTKHEIPFDFLIDTKDLGAFAGVKTLFHDYAGESFTSGGGSTLNAFSIDDMEAVSKLADSCDIVMSVIDGELVYDSIFNNDGYPTPQLEKNIGALLQYWQSTKKKKSELRQNHYFIVTKWDMFENTNEQLECVRDLIFGIDIIKYYINRLHPEYLVRIIPVSSVGYGFARRNPDTKKMEIIARQTGKPVNVEIPIACLVPELFEAELNIQQQDLEEQGEAERARGVPWWKRLLGATGRLLEHSETLQRLISDLGVHPIDIDNLAASLKSPEIKDEAMRRLKLENIAGMVSSQQEASAVVLTHFSELKRAFDQQYPSSLVQGKS